MNSQTISARLSKCASFVKMQPMCRVHFWVSSSSFVIFSSLTQHSLIPRLRNTSYSSSKRNVFLAGESGERRKSFMEAFAAEPLEWNCWRCLRWDYQFDFISPSDTKTGGTFAAAFEVSSVQSPPRGTHTWSSRWPFRKWCQCESSWSNNVNVLDLDQIK